MFALQVFTLATSLLSSSPTRVLVMPVTDGIQNAALMVHLEEMLAAEVARHADYDVLASGEVARLSGVLVERTQLGCDTAACVAELAGATDARYVVSSSVVRLGDSYSLSASFIDVPSSRVLARATRQFRDLELLPAQIGPLVADLVAQQKPVSAAVSLTTPLLATGTALTAAGVLTTAIAAVVAADQHYDRNTRQAAEYTRIAGLVGAVVGGVVVLGGVVTLCVPQP